MISCLGARAVLFLRMKDEKADAFVKELITGHHGNGGKRKTKRREEEELCEWNLQLSAGSDT